MLRTSLILLAALGLSLPTGADADCTSAGRCRVAPYASAPVYRETHHEAIVTPAVVSSNVVVQEIAVPAFSFQFLGAYAPVATAAAPAPAPAPATAPVAAAKAVAGRTLSDADIAALAKALAPRNAAAAISDDDDGPPAVGDSAPAAASPAAAPTSEQKVLAALARSCTECHGGGKSRGGVSLFDADGTFRPTRSGQPLSRAAIAEQVSTGAMPPPGKTPLDAEAAGLLAGWASGQP